MKIDIALHVNHEMKSRQLMNNKKAVQRKLTS
jgi:hypothetical protein